MTVPAPLILASTSAYRRELLDRLCLPYTVEPPGVDETPLSGESPSAAARRLSLAKARAVAVRHPGALVIGSDQTATLDGIGIIGKPGDHARAVAQLRAASGRALRFHTGVALVQDAREDARVIDTEVRYRALSDDVIERYLLRERPYDCAGSSKVETLGIALLEWVRSDDPTALVGLPLIALTGLLTAFGRPPLAP